MKFRTEFVARRCGELLNPEESVVLLGSCFTDYIGERMRECRWRAFPNTLGSLYNPSSIAKILRLLCTGGDIYDATIESITQRDELFVSWLTDSHNNTYTIEGTAHNVFYKLLRLSNQLHKAHTLIVTFGTAWVYELRERPGYIVSNCHKFPADTFIRRRLTIQEIVEEWNELLKLIDKRYPQLKVIFTVSPVRHLKDGFEENSRSKAILQLACEEICRDNERADYFPAYEIVNDDLRDYRFYASDLVHPSQEAVDYIWEKFQDCYLSKESRALLAEGEKVTKRLNHKPIVQGTSELAKYKASLEELRAAEYYNEFIEKHPGMLPIGE